MHMLSLLWVHLCSTICVLTRAGISCRRTNFSATRARWEPKWLYFRAWEKRGEVQPEAQESTLGSVSCCCLNRWPQTCWLKIMGIHHLRVLEASCPGLVSVDSILAAGQSMFLLESLWEMVFPSVFRVLVTVLIPWLMTPRCIASSLLLLSLHPFFLTLLPSSFCFKTIMINQTHQRNSE